MRTVLAIVLTLSSIALGVTSCSGSPAKSDLASSERPSEPKPINPPLYPKPTPGPKDTGDPPPESVPTGSQSDTVRASGNSTAGD